MELLKRALPFVIALEILELTVRFIWPAAVCPDTFWALTAGASAFLFLNGIFAPVTLRPYDTRPWLGAVVPAYWVAMVLHAIGTGVMVGLSPATILVGILAQGFTMLVYITLMARVPTLPTHWRHPLLLTVWWLVGSAIVTGLWVEGAELARAAWGITSPAGLALAGGLAKLFYAVWNLAWIGLSYLRQPQFFRAY